MDYRETYNTIYTLLIALAAGRMTQEDLEDNDGLE
jgi:hypothetical protein